MTISYNNASRLHKTQDKCTKCGTAYHWEHKDGVQLDKCPACRELVKTLHDDRKAYTPPLFRLTHE